MVRYILMSALLLAALGTAAFALVEAQSGRVLARPLEYHHQRRPSQPKLGKYRVHIIS